MDSRDKQFDSWMKDRLNTEIPLSKLNRHAAWEQIRLTVNQPVTDAAFAVNDDFTRITAPIVVREALQTRVWNWVSYLITQETTYHKAHAYSAHYYKANPKYSGGLMLHSLEFTRHRWTYAI